jgi:predicted CXXCH cytochrome family protein
MTTAMMTAMMTAMTTAMPNPQRPRMRGGRRRRGTRLAAAALWPAVVLCGLLPLAAGALYGQETAGAGAQTQNYCLECHSILDPPLLVTPEQYAQDFHTQKGLTCASCHGGDPTTLDIEIAKGRAAGFRGKISRAQIPRMCADCHSDAAYMRGFDPSVRTDQLSQYQTSVHGQLLARGDTKVAVCTDCHGVHGIRPGSDTRSLVHPLNVARTCARCHSDAEHMHGYRISTTQFDDYEASVHHKALAIRGDLSAPTCSTCHGTHGAAPPGVESVEYVCSTCHVFQVQLFDTSPHKPVFSAMGLPACSTCHSNHRILPTSDEMLGAGEQSLCVTCHVEGDGGYQAAVEMYAMLQGLSQAIAGAREVLDRAERSGMEVSEPLLELGSARDMLTKARVTIHSFRPEQVREETDQGHEIAAQALAAGHQALAERDYRRLGLGVSLVLILIVVLALRIYIRRIESPPAAS